MVVGKRPGQTTETGQTIRLTASNVIDTTAPYDLVSTMRASFWVVAPLLARFGEAKVSLPGGCAIGTRPVDLLIMALEKLGAEIEIDAGYVVARTKNGLRGAEVNFPKVTVGGTHVALMAASLAYGTTVIENAAREPEVVDLAECLNKMGAKIRGAGTPRIEIEGVARLNGARHEVLPDRIETGTYAMAVAMTGGDVILKDTRAELLHSALDVLSTTGAEISQVEGGIRVRRNGGGIAAVDVTTDPFPGFPTDLQAQFMALMTLAKGQSHIARRSSRTGSCTCRSWPASARRSGSRATSPSSRASSASRARPSWRPTCAPSVSLVIAGLAAEGETQINRSITSTAASRPWKPSSGAAALRSSGCGRRPGTCRSRCWRRRIVSRTTPPETPQPPICPRLYPKPGISQPQGALYGRDGSGNRLGP